MVETDDDQALKELGTFRVIRLGMTDESGPYIVPMCFAIENRSIYLHTGPDGRKVRALTHDPRVCIEADREEGVITARSACAFGIRYESVIGSGSVVFVSDPAEKIRALTLITQRYAGERMPLDEAKSASTLVIRVDPDTLTMRQRPKK